MMATKAHLGADQPRAMRLLAMVLPILSKIHLVVYRWTGGIIGSRIAGNRILLLTTMGRKTGQLRTTPVAYLSDGQAMIIIGGAAGGAQHPGWWLNLEANPEARVQVGRHTLQVSATPAKAEEQERLWTRYPAQRALFDSMQRHVSRDIPVVLLRPLSAFSGSPLARIRQTGSFPTETSWFAHAVHRAVRGFFSVGAHLLNPLMLKLAGSRFLPMLAVIQHRGRRSGRAYATPAGARPTSEGFVVPLTFGKRTDWFRNVRAAGGCVIRWKGVAYLVMEPEVVDWATARPACYPLERVLMPLIGIEQFVRLRHAPTSGPASPLSHP